jgi:single-strand DNA-binding protein
MIAFALRPVLFEAESRRMADPCGGRMASAFGVSSPRGSVCGRDVWVLNRREVGMFDTTVCLVGNVMTSPEWRRTSATNTYVATFRFASTSRRFDKATNRWVDGDSLRVKVACWRTIGENVVESVQVGDPLVVFGRLYSRDWMDSEQHRRTSYELDAIAIGHDLGRGVSKFARRRVAVVGTVEDAESDAVIAGESSERVRRERPSDIPELGSFDRNLFTESVRPPDGDDHLKEEEAAEEFTSDSYEEYDGELAAIG